MPIESTSRLISCQTGQDLAGQFAIAARLYAEAVVTLTSNCGKISQDLYDRLTRTVEEAQQHSEASGVAFKEHIESHRCGWTVLFSQTQSAPESQETEGRASHAA
jgi:sugar phosphate isomerase/epimerase